MDCSNYREQYSVPDRVLTRQDYQSALDVQNACNLSGLVISYAEAMKKVCEESHATQKGTEWRNHHPIAILYAAAVMSLSTGDIANTYLYGMAYNIAEERAKTSELG